MNGDDWSGLRRQLSRTHSRYREVVSILQIGDSHIQPDYLSGEVRRRLQSTFGDAGRGLVAPLTLARTNQPVDYIFTADVPVRAHARLMGHHPLDVGVTGIAVKFDSTYCNIGITERNDSHEFNSVTLLHAKGEGYQSARVGDDVIFAREISPYASTFDLKSLTASATLGVNSSGPLYGAILKNGRNGVLYDAIGNNGATYGSYLSIDNFGEQVKVIDPQLIIISLGTNESFGSYYNLAYNIDALIRELRHASPNAKFLLTTPMECQKKYYYRVSRRVRVRRHHYRRVSSYRTGHSVNSRIAEVRDIILDYGKRHHVPVWDLYSVAGGDGSSYKWIENSLMKKDHIHCYQSGYELQGKLLSEALLEKLH